MLFTEGVLRTENTEINGVGLKYVGQQCDLHVFRNKKEYQTRNEECPILRFKGISNNEQGMSNIEVLACVN